MHVYHNRFESLHAWCYSVCPKDQCFPYLALDGRTLIANLIERCLFHNYVCTFVVAIVTSVRIAVAPMIGHFKLATRRGDRRGSVHQVDKRTKSEITCEEGASVKVGLPFFFFIFFYASIRDPDAVRRAGLRSVR